MKYANIEYRIKNAAARRSLAAAPALFSILNSSFFSFASFFILLSSFYFLLSPALANASVVIGHANLNTLSNGLVGYWPLDGATTNWGTGITQDISGQGNNGQMTSMSTSTSVASGKIGQALNFNGTNYVDIGNVGAYTSNFSISFWVKQQATAVAEASVIEKRNAQTAGWAIGITSSNQLVWRTFNGGSQFNILGNLGSFAITNGIWYHVVIVHTSGSASIYVNGVDKSGTHAITDPAADATATRLAFQNGGASKLVGSLDDVRIYNRALSVQEVSLLYALGSINVAHSNTAPGSGLNSGLVGYWPLDGDTTNWTKDTTQDVSGSGNTGSLANMSTSTSPVAGRIGGALKFNGVNGYSLVASTTALELLILQFPEALPRGFR